MKVAASVTFLVSLVLILGILFWAFHNQWNKVKDYFSKILGDISQRSNHQAPTPLSTTEKQLPSAPQNAILGLFHRRRREPRANLDEESPVANEADIVEVRPEKK